MSTLISMEHSSVSQQQLVPQHRVSSQLLFVVDYLNSPFYLIAGICVNVNWMNVFG